MGSIGIRGGNKAQVKYSEDSIQQALYKQKPILTNPALEMIGFIFYAWESDYLIVSNSGYVYECEIKISHSDFLNENKHKSQKMRLLKGEEMTVSQYNHYEEYGIEIDDKPMMKPNYFWYVCPEGVISESECPEFAGLMYITNSGTFRCIKYAPCLHKIKYDEQIKSLNRNMQNKFYYAMWNWIRRYWNNNKMKDISSQNIIEYEKALDKKDEDNMIL